MAGTLLYRGPSMLDGSPIIVIATIRNESESTKANTKTGNLVQTWILREDVSPVLASKNGQDSAICGSCRLRANPETGQERACYVTVFQAPRSVWESYHRGIYPDASDAESAAAFGRGRVVRLGSYGDPAAVPTHVWANLLAESLSHTGYSHQWRNPAVDLGLQHFVMASCDRPSDYAEANAAGWRTFRVRAEEQEVFPGEITCPASKEAGHRTTCKDCKLCGGTSTKTRKNIVIIAHGAKHIAERAAALARS